MSRSKAVWPKWRALQDDELESIWEAVALRKALPQHERHSIQTPQAVFSTVAGAVLWALHIILQDHPYLVGIAALAVGWQAYSLLTRALTLL